MGTRIIWAERQPARSCRKEHIVSVAKTIELSGTSSDGFEAAINDVIAKAGETLRNIEGAWVKEQKVVVSDGRVTGYRVHLEVTFVLD